MTNEKDLSTSAQQHMASVISRIATGPDLSKNLSREETKQATVDILNGKINPVRAAIFFIALRMKRETTDENRGLLDGIRSVATTAQINIPELVDLSDPYNGYNRSLPISPFLPALLAAAEIPCVSHGLLTCSPKFGVTHKQVLDAAGLNTNLTVDKVAKRIEQTGWGYVDQSKFCEPLHRLIDFRTLAIKRLPLTTVEVAIGPIRAQKTHLVTGYVHKPYPPVYADLAMTSGFDSAILVRGVEGGIVPSLRQQVKIYRYQKGATDSFYEQEFDSHPEQIGIKQSVRSAVLPEKLKVPDDNEAIAKLAAQNGLDALAGKQGIAYDALVYSASIIATQIGRFKNIQSASRCMREILDSQKARGLI